MYIKTGNQLGAGRRWRLIDKPNRFLTRLSTSLQLDQHLAATRIAPTAKWPISLQMNWLIGVQRHFKIFWMNGILCKEMSGMPSSAHAALTAGICPRMKYPVSLYHLAWLVAVTQPTVQLSYSKYFSKIRHWGIECFYSNFSRRFQIWNQIFNIGSTFFFSD